MKKIMTEEIEEYDIVETLTLGGLVKTVNKKIAQGWQPLGGICSRSATTHVQALVRKKSND